MGTGPGEFWILGTPLVHWRNGAGSLVTWPLGADPYAAWASGPNDVWWAGGRDSAQLLHWDGSAFSQDSTPPLGPTLYAVGGAGPGDIWVGGAGGALLRTSLDAPAVPTH